MHRNEVEGIRVGGANGANDNFLSDFASFAEIAVNAVGHSATMPVPGTMAPYVSKSGGKQLSPATSVRISARRARGAITSMPRRSRAACPAGAGSTRDVNRLRIFVTSTPMWAAF